MDITFEEYNIVEEGVSEYKTPNGITYGIIGCAFRVHKALGRDYWNLLMNRV